ncbi:MAG: type II toxin-antitoxin system death-on-curing family toxin [Vicinamibacterales bacterium]
MKAPVWVLRDTVLALHEQLLALYGGAAGVRDVGLFDSALARPKNLFAYEKATVFALGASYAFGLIKNHPFVDGNKRVGFAVAVLFLQLNGRRFEGGQADAAVQTLGLAAGAIGEAEYAAWLTANSRRRAR